MTDLGLWIICDNTAYSSVYFRTQQWQNVTFMSLFHSPSSLLIVHCKIVHFVFFSFGMIEQSLWCIYHELIMKSFADDVLFLMNNPWQYDEVVRFSLDSQRQNVTFMSLLHCPSSLLPMNLETTPSERRVNNRLLIGDSATNSQCCPCYCSIYAHAGGIARRCKMVHLTQLYINRTLCIAK